MKLITVPVGPTAAPVSVADAGTEAIANSTGAAVLYGITLPVESDEDHYAVFNGDGAATAWDSSTIPCLVNATALVSTGNTAAATLGVVAKANGDLLKRIGSDDIAATGEFAIVGGARSEATLTFLDQPASSGGETIALVDTLSGTVTFEFAASGGTVTTGNTHVYVATGGLSLTAANFATAVNASTGIDIYAGTPEAAAEDTFTLSLLQVLPGADGDTTSTLSAAALEIVDFAGGSDDGVTVEFGDVYAATDKLELIVGQTITTASALTANTKAERELQEIMTAGVAAAQVLVQ